ncbi:MAG TPA: ubiquinol-cytochrome C chaperone family protein [Hansschlegelia sp.]
MIFGLLRKRAPAELSVTETIYAGIVADARRPAFYRDLGAPDTLPGRFELIVLHVSLYLRRLSGEGPEAAARAQGVLDAMFASLDASLREMGIGDLTVPKKIKAMASSFYDGLALYDAALSSGDREALASALRRIVYRDAGAGDGPERLADYVALAADALSAQPVDTLVSTGPSFPAIEGEA